jgi:hypothetical protein
MYYHVLGIFYLTMCAIMFIELWFSFMSGFAYFNPHVVSYFFLSHLWFELCNPVAGGSP